MTWLILVANFVFASSDTTCLRVLNAHCAALDKVERVGGRLVARLKNGTTLPCDPPRSLDSADDQDFQQLLNTARLTETLLQPYSFSSRSTPEPRRNWDPGRIRNEAIFRATYGASKAEIERNLILIEVPPYRFAFNSKNGAAVAMKNILLELRGRPALWSWLTTKRKFGGAYNYRPIAGTSRLSTHSYAIAVDFTPLDGATTYWRWSAVCKPNTACKDPLNAREEDLVLVPPRSFDVFDSEVLKVFEKHGFISGAKWHHYDTMHLEYRPEFLARPLTCSKVLSATLH